MQLVVDGLLTSYKKTGSGKKTILCIHGWADSKQTFNQLTEKLENNYTLVSLDLPGFGESEKPAKAWTIDDFAGFISRFVEKLGLRVDGIIGHSNGGSIAIRVLSTKKLQSKKLILIASAGIRSPRSIKNQTLKVLAKPVKLAIKIAPKHIQSKIKKKFYRFIGSDYMVADNMKETFKNIVTTDLIGDAKKIHQPTILIYGTKDTSTPLEYGKKFENAIPSGKLFVINEADHFVHRERANEVSELIKEFLG